MDSEKIKKVFKRPIFFFPLLIVTNGFFILNIPKINLVFIPMLIICTVYLLKQDKDEAVANYFVLSIMFLMPLIIAKKQIATLTEGKLNYIYICSAIMLLYMVFKYKDLKFHKTLKNYSFICYFILIFFSTIFSVDLSRSIAGANNRYEGLITLMCYGLVFLISNNYYQFKKRHLNYLVFSSFLVAAYGISQYFGFDPFRDLIKGFSRYYSYSTIGNSNFLGSYITLMLPICFFSYIYSSKIIYLINSCILFLSMMCTYTRSSWIAFIVYIFFISFYTLKYSLSKKNLLVIISLLAITFFSFNYMENNQVYTRMFSLFNDTKKILNSSDEFDNGGSGRVFIWRRAITLVNERPLLGSGPDTFDLVFMPKYKEEVNVFRKNLIYDKAHNEYLQIAVTTGIPALLCYLVFLATIGVKAVKNVKNNILLIPIGCSVLGYIVQAFFNISVVPVAPIFWALLGILAQFTDETKNNNILDCFFIT